MIPVYLQGNIKLRSFRFRLEPSWPSMGLLQLFHTSWMLLATTYVRPPRNLGLKHKQGGHARVPHRREPLYVPAWFK